ncbi:MAG TPA: hypothetical protein VLW52_10865 [Opitutaceae bacterium]|nr:hypothetical protein [Opitutaceae bacterium]
MKILHPDSLIATVDAFNEAVFQGRPWQREAPAIVDWMGGRLGQSGAYAGSFALTERDWSREFRLFTGERLSTRAGRAHVIAEEATRVLTLIKRDAGLDCAARELSEERLRARIFDAGKSTVREDGLYCCGTCSVAFWRSLAAGVFKRQNQTLRRGVATLGASRDARGGWGRFPFYYTLLLLSEIPPELAKQEFDFCAPRGRTLVRHLARKADRYSTRRRELLRRIWARSIPG